MRARLTVDSRPGRTFPGTVTRMAPFVEDRLDQNRTVDIEAELQVVLNWFDEVEETVPAQFR